MSQSNWVERAQQGDPAAIATLLNRILKPRGVTAKVLLKQGCLKVLLVSDRPLNQQTFVGFIQKQVSRFHSEAIASIQVYGQQIGEDAPAWAETVLPVVQNGLAEKAIVHQNAVVSATTQGKAIDNKDFIATLRTFQFSAVFPYREVFSTDLFQNSPVKLLLFLGLFPLVVDLITDDSSLAETAWLFGVYYASIWGVVLHDLIKPPKFSWGNSLKCVFFTTFVGIPLLLFFQRVPPFSAFYAAIWAGPIPRVIGFVLGVGVLEELSKSLSVYLFVLRPGKLQDPLTFAFYGCMSGLGFAIAEGATYSLMYGFGLSRGQLGVASYLIINTVRFISLPLFHAILSGIVGYFIGLAAINPSRRGAIIFIGVAIAACLHGFYNTFAGSIIGLLIIGFSILLFVTYLQRSKHMIEAMEQAELARKGRS